MMKKQTFLILLFMTLLLENCSFRRNAECREINKHKVDTSHIKKEFLAIVDSFCLNYPQYRSVTIYSKFFVNGSEGLCAYSSNPYTYYVIGPSAKCMFERDKFGHKILYPVSWFETNGKYVFLQSGQDALFSNESFRKFYEKNMDSTIVPESFSMQAWVFRTNRNDACQIVSKDILCFLKDSPEKILSPLNIK